MSEFHLAIQSGLCLTWSETPKAGFHVTWLKNVIVGITNPNSETQADLMRMLYKRSGIKYEEVKFVEAHGTGTQVSVFGLYILLCLKFAMD